MNTLEYSDEKFSSLWNNFSKDLTSLIKIRKKKNHNLHSSLFFLQLKAIISHFKKLFLNQLQRRMTNINLKKKKKQFSLIIHLLMCSFFSHKFNYIYFIYSFIQASTSLLHLIHQFIHFLIQLIYWSLIILNFIHLFFYINIHSFNLFFHSIMHLFIYLTICLFNSSLIRWFIYSLTWNFIKSPIQSIIHQPICWFIHLLVYSWTLLFIYPFIQPFIN